MADNGDNVDEHDYSEVILYSLKKLTPYVIDQMTTDCCVKLVLADMTRTVLIVCGVIDSSVRVSAQPIIDAHCWSLHDYSRFVSKFSSLGLESAGTYPLVLTPRPSAHWDESFYKIRKHVRYCLDGIDEYSNEKEIKFQLYENFKVGGKRFPIFAQMLMGKFADLSIAKEAADCKKPAYDSSMYAKPKKNAETEPEHALLITGMDTRHGKFICEVKCSYGLDWGDQGFSRVLIKEFSRIYVPRYERPPYLPVYISLPMGTINKNSQLTDPGGLQKQLRMLKAIQVDGIKVHCWWGIVERNVPLEYAWDGYEILFEMAYELRLRIQVVLSFHEYKSGFDHIPLPNWVMNISKENPDIFFKNKKGRHNSDYLSWGIDNQNILGERTGLQVYQDFMRSFSKKFHKYLATHVINMIEIGVGPYGEPRYPYSPISTDVGQIGEFMCYDKYMETNMKEVAATQGLCECDEPPETGGFYDSHPNDTKFFCDGGTYKENKGLFFLNWYSQKLLHHVDDILALARFTFEDTDLLIRIPQIYSRYKTKSHAAELTAGFHNTSQRDICEEVVDILLKHDIMLHHTLGPSSSTALGDPDSYDFATRIMKRARADSVTITCENALPCVGKEELEQTIEKVKHGLYNSFTYTQLSSLVMDPEQYRELTWFIMKMHGEIID